MSARCVARHNFRAVGYPLRLHAGDDALATALHIRYDHVRRGESTSSVMPAVTRLAPPDDAGVAAHIAQALGARCDGMSAAAAASADALEQRCRALGRPVRIGELGIPRADLPALARDTLKNFNANPGARPGDHVERMLGSLEAAW